MIGELLAYHDDETVARETAEDYLAAAERHVEAYRALERHAGERNLPVARLDAWPQWRDAAEMLAATGKAVLANEDRYDAYLDAVTIGRSRAQLTVPVFANVDPGAIRVYYLSSSCAKALVAVAGGEEPRRQPRTRAISDRSRVRAKLTNGCSHTPLIGRPRLPHPRPLHALAVADSTPSYFRD